MNIPNPDTINRTALIGAYDGSHPRLEAAIDAHAGTGVAIVADPAACNDILGQAALCTAMATAARAFGTVTLMTDDGATFTAGPYMGRTIADAAAAEGVRLVPDLRGVPQSWPVLLVGPHTPQLQDPQPCRRTVLRLTWTGWTAHVQPAALPVPAAGAPGNTLSAIAAAALGVHEAFAAVQDRPGSDAGHRTFRLNLWRPGTETDDGPPLTHAPAGWWLVGLGHLGQACAWVIAWLNYANPTNVPIVLCDTDKAVSANHSTGILTPRNPAPIRKTRIVAGVLDRIGFDTYLVERHLDATTRATDTDFHVALVGVDNLPTRRLISAVQWSLAIDAGIGAGPSDFDAILLRRFPAARASHDIAGWADPAVTNTTLPDTPAFDDLRRRDPCGVVEVAGTAVGASFVGVTAACLAVTEGIRELLGGDGYDTLSLHLQTDDVHYAPATVLAEVIPAPLALEHTTMDRELAVRTYVRSHHESHSRPPLP